MIIKLKGAQEAAGTSSTNGSNVGSATLVLVQNTSTTAYLVTLETAAASPALIGSFTIMPSSTARLVKEPTDEIFAENAAIKLTPIGYTI